MSRTPVVEEAEDRVGGLVERVPHDDVSARHRDRAAVAASSRRRCPAATSGTTSRIGAANEQRGGARRGRAAAPSPSRRTPRRPRTVRSAHASGRRRRGGGAAAVPRGRALVGAGLAASRSRDRLLDRLRRTRPVERSSARSSAIVRRHPHGRVEQDDAVRPGRDAARRARAPVVRRSCGRRRRRARDGARPACRRGRRRACRGSTAAPSRRRRARAGRARTTWKASGAPPRAAEAAAPARDAVQAEHRRSVRRAPVVHVQPHVGETTGACSRCSTTSTRTCRRSRRCSPTRARSGATAFLLGGDLVGFGPFPARDVRVAARDRRAGDLHPRQRRALAARAADRPAGDRREPLGSRAPLLRRGGRMAVPPSGARGDRRRRLRARLLVERRRQLRARAAARRRVARRPARRPHARVRALALSVPPARRRRTTSS